LWCALAAAVFLTTVGKIGGAPYYAAELAVLGAIGLGLLSARVLAPLSEAHRSGDRTVVIQAGLVTVGLAAVAWLTITSELAPGRWSTASAGAAHAQVVAAMRTAPGPILSDFAGDLLLAGRSDEVVDLRGVVQLANARQFDERPIVEQLQHGNFALLALDFDPLSTTAAEMQSSADTRLTPAMLAAVQASYQVNQTVTFRPSGRVAVLLVPKGSTP
jgi:hypothetical protein